MARTPVRESAPTSGPAHDTDEGAATERGRPPARIVILPYTGVLADSSRSPVRESAAQVLLQLAGSGARMILADRLLPGQTSGERTAQLRAAGVSWCFDAVVETSGCGAAACDTCAGATILEQVHRIEHDGRTYALVWVEAGAHQAAGAAHPRGTNTIRVTEVRGDAVLVHPLTDVTGMPGALGPSPAPVGDRGAQPPHTPVGEASCSGQAIRR
jgi:hypothetical protein